MNLVSSYGFNDVRVSIYCPKKFDESKKYLSLIFNDGDFLDSDKMEIGAIGLTSVNRNDDYPHSELAKSIQVSLILAERGRNVIRG